MRHRSLSYSYRNSNDRKQTSEIQPADHSTRQMNPSEGIDYLEGNNIIVSIIENRAREICVCKVDTSNMSQMEVYIMTDNHSYAETCGVIDDINPVEVLLPDGSRNSIISKKMEELARVQGNNGLRIIYISRQYFDQDRGAEFLRKVLRGQADADLIAKYTVLAGSYCLLRYVENCLGSSIANNSLRLVYCNNALGNRMSIDRKTIVNLELVSNLKTGSQKHSLFDIMNFTKTSVGSRLLRENIIKPVTDIATLNTRLGMVEILIRSRTAVINIQSILSLLPDIDKTLSGLVTVSKSQTIRTARRGIDTLIFIKQTIRSCEYLADALMNVSQEASNEQHLEQQLLHAIISVIEKPELRDIQHIIDDIVSESTSYTKSQHEMRHQECFAVRSGRSGELDVARKAYLQTVEDICSMADRYTQEHQVSVKVVYNMSRGFHITIPANVSPMPKGFIQAVQNSRTISCTTDEVMSLSDRAAENIASALSITQQLIQDSLTSIRTHVEVLFNIADAIALIDMLVSFSELVQSSSDTYVRPLLTNASTNDDIIVLLAARHPVASHPKTHRNAVNAPFVPNDCFLSPLDNLQIITGPNGSGKTLYIKQVVLVIIMGQMGCFVPARHATIAMRDRILSRIGTSDDMEHNLSTFATEMKEIAYVTSNITPRSLIIIDELGRGTSNIDGLSIAFSVAESFVASNAYTLFVSHYMQLISIADLYPNAKNIHMRTTIDLQPITSDTEASNSNTNMAPNHLGLRYLHVIGTGPCDMRCGYGIMLASKCGFPVQVIQKARTYQRIVRDQYPVLLNINTIDDTSMHMRELLQHLLILRNSRLDNQSIRSYVQNLRGKVSYDLCEKMKAILAVIGKKFTPALNIHLHASATSLDRPLSNVSDHYDDNIEDSHPIQTEEDNRLTNDENSPYQSMVSIHECDHDKDATEQSIDEKAEKVLYKDVDLDIAVVSPPKMQLHSNASYQDTNASYHMEFDPLLDLMQDDLSPDKEDNHMDTSHDELDNYHATSREAWKNDNRYAYSQSSIDVQDEQTNTTKSQSQPIAKKRKSVD